MAIPSNNDITVELTATKFFMRVTSVHICYSCLQRKRFGLLSASAPGEEVEDQDCQGDDEQYMNQSARNVEAESQKPQDQNYDKDGPEHNQYLSALRALETGIQARTHPVHSKPRLV
jgi:hypothetical protein